MTSQIRAATPRSWLTLLVFLLFVVGGGMLIGLSFPPGEWYAGLEKPPFNPPNWIFAPVWTVLYVLIAITGWRTWRRAPAGLPMQIWFAQLALNFVWSWAFFGIRSPELALTVIAGMLLLILAFIAVVWNSDRVAALMFAPYAAWVAFAGLLNASILWLN